MLQSLAFDAGGAAMTDLPSERDEQLAEALLGGMTFNQARRRFRLSQAELDSALERCWPIDLNARLRLIRRDAAQISELARVFYEKALAGDVEAPRTFGLDGRDANRASGRRSAAASAKLVRQNSRGGLEDCSPRSAAE